MWLMIGTVVLEKNMLTHDDGHQPITKDHKSDSCDLKITGTVVNAANVMQGFAKEFVISIRIVFLKVFLKTNIHSLLSLFIYISD